MKFSRFTLLVLVILFVNQAFHAIGSPAEWIIRRTPSGAWPASTGIVTVWPMNQPPETTTVEVVGTNGVVGSRILWARTGDPWMIMFDTSSGEESYTLRFGQGGANPSEWTPHAGLILSTRPRGTKPVNTFEETQAAWHQATNLCGRSLVPSVFDGANRHGNGGDIISRYDGWFQAPKDGRYAFATLSVDASFLLIDQHPVVEWVGRHGVDGGRRGEHQGAIELKHGLHALEYWNVANGPDVMAVLAWRAPGDSGMSIMPPSAFAPVAAFSVTTVSGENADAIFSWEIASHARAENGLIIGLRLRAINAPEGAAVRWRFDDGTESHGVECLHPYAQEGFRRVMLTTTRPGKNPQSNMQVISIHPCWSQLMGCSDSVVEELRGALLALPLASMSPSDLAGFLCMAESVEDWGWVDALGSVIYPRRNLFTAAQGDALYRLGLYYQRPRIMKYDRVIDLWQSVINDPTAPRDLHARAALRLADFLVQTLNNIPEAMRLLNEEAGDVNLSGDDRRLKIITRADALALTGQPDAALAAYRQAGAMVNPGDTYSEARRRIRIETARDYIRREEFDAAEQVLRALEWAQPIERMGVECGLLMTAVFRGRGENLMALGLCRRLLATAPADPRRPDLLLVSAEVCRDLKRDAESHALVSQLLAEHPYSEAASQVRDRFHNHPTP